MEAKIGRFVIALFVGVPLAIVMNAIAAGFTYFTTILTFGCFVPQDLLILGATGLAGLQFVGGLIYAFLGGIQYVLEDTKASR